MLRILIKDDPTPKNSCCRGGATFASMPCSSRQAQAFEPELSGCIKTLIYYRRLGFCASEASRRPTGTSSPAFAFRRAAEVLGWWARNQATDERHGILARGWAGLFGGGHRDFLNPLRAFVYCMVASPGKGEPLTPSTVTMGCNRRDLQQSDCPPQVWGIPARCGFFRIESR